MKFIDTSFRFVAGVCFHRLLKGAEMNRTEKKKKTGSFELGSEIPVAELCLK